MKMTAKPFGTPPAKHAKRLPAGMACKRCDGALRSLSGYWLERGQYATECKAGCWACADCGETHSKAEICLLEQIPAGRA